MWRTDGQTADGRAIAYTCSAYAYAISIFWVFARTVRLDSKWKNSHNTICRHCIYQTDRVEKNQSVWVKLVGMDGWLASESCGAIWRFTLKYLVWQIALETNERPPGLLFVHECFHFSSRMLQGELELSRDFWSVQSLKSRTILLHSRPHNHCPLWQMLTLSLGLLGYRYHGGRSMGGQGDVSPYFLKWRGPLVFSSPYSLGSRHFLIHWLRYKGYCLQKYQVWLVFVRRRAVFVRTVFFEDLLILTVFSDLHSALR